MTISCQSAATAICAVVPPCEDPGKAAFPLRGPSGPGTPRPASGQLPHRETRKHEESGDSSRRCPASRPSPRLSGLGGEPIPRGLGRILRRVLAPVDALLVLHQLAVTVGAERDPEHADADQCCL